MFSETFVADSLTHICKNDEVEWLEIFYGVKRVNLDVSLRCGLTPFLLSCKYNSKKCIIFFIKNGFLNGRKNVHITALTIACDQHNLPLLNLLLKVGVNVDERNIEGETVLIHSCSTANHAATEMLIRSGANLNMVDSYGKTALIHAVESNSKKCVRLLLDAGAMVYKKDNAGNTASTIANNMMHSDILHMMKEHMKKTIGKCTQDSSIIFF